MTAFQLAVRHNLSIRGGVGSTFGVESASSSSSPITLGFDEQTPEQISIYCPLSRTVASGTTATVRYKLVGASTWIDAHPLLQIIPSEIAGGSPLTVVEAFAGVIFDLQVGATYSVEVTLHESGQSDVVLTATRATSSLPGPAGTTTATVALGGNVQTALNALAPGSVLQIGDGLHTVSSLTMSVSGTLAQPIYVRGESRTGTILKDVTGAVLTLGAGLSYVIFENLTFQGSGVDDGLTSQSIGVLPLNTGAAQSNVTIRQCNFFDVDRGIKAYESTVSGNPGGVNSVLIYECDFRGNNTWDKSYFDNDPGVDYLPNLTWNDDCISLPGRGNCAWNNTIKGFGDAFSVKDLVASIAVFYYRNLIKNTGDDAFEGDYSIRNIGFYDNYIGNSSSLLSLDPLWGGPLYCFRNTSINSHSKPFKLTNINSGALIYNNTILRLDGTASVAGIYMANTFAQRSFSLRNNIFVHRGSLPTFNLQGDFNRVDCDHNSWFAGTSFTWNVNGPYASIAAAFSGLPAKVPLFSGLQRHADDNLVTSNPWAATVTLGSDHTTEYTAYQRLTITGGNASASGVVIPGITDGYTGAAPDRGAEITGRAAVTYGCADYAGPNSWVLSQTVNTWRDFSALGTDTLDAWNPDNDPTANPNTPANSTTAPWRRAGGHAGIVRAWSGAAFDAVNGVLWFPYCGGHNDGHPNAVYKLDLNRAIPRYQRVNNPSGSVGMTAVSWDNTVPPFSLQLAEMSDGRPRAHHTENFAFYWPGQGPGIASEIIVAPGGGFEFGRNRPNLFSPITGERTFLGANKNNEAAGGYCSACWDSNRNGVWKMPSSGSPTFSYWGGPTDDVWHDKGSFQSYAGATSLTHWPTADLILVGNGGNDLVAGGGSADQSVTGGWQIFDPVTGTLHSPTFIGAPTTRPAGLSTGLWPGNCQPRWSEILQCFLAWDMAAGSTTQILKIIPPSSGNPRTADWTLAYMPVAGSNTVTPSARTNTGTWGRFWLWETSSFGICGVVNNTNEAGFVYRYA